MKILFRKGELVMKKVRCITSAFFKVHKAELYNAEIYGTDSYTVYDKNGEEIGCYSQSYFEEIFEEQTLLEKVTEHFGVVEGEKFNIIGSGWNPYTLSKRGLCDKYGDCSAEWFADLIIGKATIEKIPRKSEKDLAIERARQKIKEAHEELEKAEQMK